ncbi:Gfo/Idh/MocA family protein [Marinifilum caeruleilacunae]|uniref:Gfo/Idh/MocA family oxidoreductase n=1 Tax=Marinifilum caeruleilacunae TaxID=2499076 RepID=A0ABX1WRJ7_9BACT|nr:Gfo/Idh/MocA family oxidoreductase [Marinifilum caeruleilacunae]NOU58697.1 Gfo/Idh/MocA family oxidoreductase [Marinifilum caeruleilacunae]
MTVSWGILGAGKIANKFANDFKVVPNGKIIAVASRSESKASNFAEKYQIEHSYTSYESMMSNPDIQVVYVATPHNFHFEHASLCLNHGKAVLCEKPVCVNAAQLEQLSNLAKEKGLFFMEGMWTYYLPAILKSMEWIDAGKIGDVLQLQVSFGFVGDMKAEGRLANANLAGGALLDIGIYGVAISELVFNQKIDSIQSFAEIGKTGIDEYNSIQLKYANGGLSQISSSFRSNLKNEAVIYGTKGRIEIPSFWMAKKTILYTENEILEFEDESKELGYNYEAYAVGELIKKGKLESSIIPIWKSKKILSVLDEIRDQIELKYPFED